MIRRAITRWLEAAERAAFFATLRPIVVLGRGSAKRRARELQHLLRGAPR